MDKVAIAIPVYSNAEVVRWVIDSVLNQTHDNLSITVFDNGFADGLTEVSEVLGRFEDKRLSIVKNPTNVGHYENFRKCFREVSNHPYGMVLPADIALLSKSVETLMSRMRESSSEIAYSSAVHFGDLERASAFMLSPESGFQEDNGFVSETFKSSEIIAEFTSDLNLGGEYNRFSIFGSLGKGYLFHRVGNLESKYGFHAWEHQNSILFAAPANRITLTKHFLQVALTGLEKSPGLERPRTDWTRIETIMASYETITHLRNENHIFSGKLDREKLRSNHLKLLDHYKDVYGFHRFVAAVIKAVLRLHLSDSRALHFIFSLLVLIRFRAK